MSYMFYNSLMHIEANLEDWNVESVTKMDFMFSHSYFFRHNISRWNVVSVSSLENMFQVVPLLSDCIKRSIQDAWTPTLTTNNVFWPYPHWIDHDATNDCETYDCEANHVPDCVAPHCVRV